MNGPKDAATWAWTSWPAAASARCPTPSRSVAMSCPCWRQQHDRPAAIPRPVRPRSEEHTSELQSRGQIVCSILLDKKKLTHVVYQYYITECPSVITLYMRHESTI